MEFFSYLGIIFFAIIVFYIVSRIHGYICDYFYLKEEVSKLTSLTSNLRDMFIEIKQDSLSNVDSNNLAINTIFKRLRKIEEELSCPEETVDYKTGKIVKSRKRK